MSHYTAEVTWSRAGQNFLDNKYSRRHTLRFDGGVEIAGSSSPQVVPPPMSDESAVDPEEAFVASLSACHMLWFLSIAASKGLVVDRYHDKALGVLDLDGEGRLAITLVTLRPEALFAGDTQPSFEQVETMHQEAHERCFIANSVRTRICCEPVCAERVAMR